MNNTSYIRTCSFFDIHLTISDYLKYGVITKQQYNNVFSSLISYASKQDINNSILITYKDELLNNEQNFYNILHNRLIYMNNTYSVLVLDYRTDSFVRLSYKAKNLLDLQQANLNHKEELTNKLANNNLLAEQYQTYQTLQGCNSLQDLLRSVYIFQIEKIKTNQFIVNSIMKEHHQLDNTLCTGNTLNCLHLNLNIPIMKMQSLI
uniref:hypothetical protein n=1 Tax=Porodaedalea chrysoloma TaxID=74615 RepID=UPI0023AB0D9F|nr:hypothetical protein P1S03_mgp07 [Porodaedalea chrysoloma]WCF76799.1 hypothetical protein [Porodaedalea chrysoloma]